MEKEKVLRHFQETRVEGKTLEALLALEEYFQIHKDELAVAFIESFRQICLHAKAMQDRQEKGKTGYITFSMLRTEILEKRHLYLIEAFNNRWFFDRTECWGEYDAGWAFQFLDRLGEELDKERKVYMDVLHTPDIETIMLREAEKFHRYVIALAKYAMPKAAQLKEFRETAREEELEVRVGEYMDLSEVVYKEDTRTKDPEEIKAWLGQKAEHEYTYEVFAHLDLSHGDYGDTDLRYADFRGSNLSGSLLRRCILVGAKFSGCRLNQANFSQTFLHDADFSHCSLKQAVFAEAEGACGLDDPTRWEMPGYTGVKFEGADLEGACFRNANLKGADFTGANLKDTDFEGARLEKAVFSREAAEILKLDDGQRKTVCWKT